MADVKHYLWANELHLMAYLANKHERVRAFLAQRVCDACVSYPGGNNEDSARYVALSDQGRKYRPYADNEQTYRDADVEAPAYEGYQDG